VNSSGPFASPAVPGDSPDAWGVFVDNTLTTPGLTFSVFAVCAPAGQVFTKFKAKRAAKKWGEVTLTRSTLETPTR
jgi:hypothetical protein